MKKLAIIGSSDLGQLIAYHAANDKQFEVVGYFDDFAEKNKLINGVPVIGAIESVLSSFKNKMFDELIIGIGYKHFAFRKKMYETFSKKIPMATIIHSSAYIDKSATIAEGVFILPGCILDKNVVIKENVLLNTGCIIAHDSIVNAHSFLSPSVAVAGFVTIGESCSIGINSTIIDNINIAGGTQIGGGAVVIKNIEQAGLYVGNPAKFIR